MRLLLLLVVFAACRPAGDGPRAAPPAATGAPAEAPVQARTHHPAAAGLLDTGAVDHAGRPRGIACATCHGNEVSPGVAQGLEAGRELHAGLVFEHGRLDCLACHTSPDPGGLHLADGTPLGFEGAVRLCGQCHGPQHRDYEHGAHGGMTGFWDASRGGRERNSCLVCHDAHRPAYPGILPAAPPRDRGMNLARGDHP